MTDRPMPSLLRIGEVRIAGASRIEAQRLGDELPAALDRAMARYTSDRLPRRRSLADQVADAIVQQAFARLELSR